MSGYRLKATDGSGSYSIPKGETVIGRGPFLAISDKRVSRSHAVLEVVDDQLRIKPVHVNPCFYQASDKSKFAPLERNEWRCLHSGDCFSLLPEKYSFQVIAEHLSEEATLRNIDAFDEDCAVKNGSACSPLTSITNVVSDEPSSLFTDDYKPALSPPPATCGARKNEKCDDMSPAVRCRDVEQSGSAPRKRVLPSWMLQEDLPIQSLTSPVIKAGKKKRKTMERNMSSTKNVECPVEKPHKSSVKLNEESRLKNKSCEVESEQVYAGTSSSSLPGTTVLGSSHKSPVQNNIEEEMGADSCDNTPDLSPQVQTSESPSVKHHKPSNSKATGNQNLSLSPGSPGMNQQATKKRTPCMYGEKCYRKNPAHFEEFCHPGDSDYVENGSQDDSDNRPECPYGTDCYRKNPQHKLEYKHTKPPARSVLDDDSDNDGNPNEYDMNDSFIDDDEEEDFDNTDEDSDYVPDSEEKDREDIKQLLKEAKRFVKRKR